MFLLTATLIVMIVAAMNRAFDWVHDQERNVRTLIEASNRSELLGRPVEMLVPPRQATDHDSERAGRQPLAEGALRKLICQTAGGKEGPRAEFVDRVLDCLAWPVSALLTPELARKEERTMRILSTLISLTLAVLVAFAAAQATSFAADTTRPRVWCWWDGTPPLCDGSCGSGRFVGAYQDANEARRAGEAVVSGVRDDNAWKSFGKACVTGKKARCCASACPNAYAMVGDLCKKVTTKTRGLELPVPEEAAKIRRKGPIVAPGLAEETELNKGPIVKPEAPYATKRKTGPLTQD